MIDRAPRRHSTVKVYLSVVRGIFLRAVVGVEGFMTEEKEPYFRTFYYPYSDFSIIDISGKNWNLFSFLHY